MYNFILAKHSIQSVYQPTFPFTLETPNKITQQHGTEMKRGWKTVKSSITAHITLKGKLSAIIVLEIFITFFFALLGRALST